jgi:hypothetical protein
MDDAAKQKYAGKYLYELSFTNKGGLVMPIILQVDVLDGTKETEIHCVQIWRKDENM